MGNNDTSLVRMVINKLVEKNKWDYGYAMERFYNSNVCKGLSDENTGIFTFSPSEVVELFESESLVIN